MAYTRSNLGWSSDQWQRLNKAVQDMSASSRIVRPLLPLFGNAGGFVNGVPNIEVFDTAALAAAAQPGVAAAAVGASAAAGGQTVAQVTTLARKAVVLAAPALAPGGAQAGLQAAAQAIVAAATTAAATAAVAAVAQGVNVAASAHAAAQAAAQAALLASGPPRLAIPSSAQLIPVELSCDFFVDPEWVADEDFVTGLAVQAANLVAQAEDAVLINGAAAALPATVTARNLFVQDGLAPAGLGVIPAGDRILDQIVAGIATLRGRNFTSPFNVILDPQAYQRADTPQAANLVSDVDSIRNRMRGGGFVDSPALGPNRGLIFSLGGNQIDLTVPVDARVEVVHEERGALLRVVEQFRLRIKDRNAIASLA